MTAAVLKRVAARQDGIWAYVDFDYTMLTTAADIPAIQVPQGAVLTGGFLVVDTVWNSATSDVLSVGDATTFNRFLSAHTIAATGFTALVPTGFKYTAPTLITVRWVGVGAAPSTGAGTLYLQYIKRGRARFDEGLDYGSRLA